MTLSYKYANFAQSTLQASITAGATSLQIASSDASKFPALSVGTEAFRAVIYDDVNAPEIVECTAIAGNILTITRAQESTAAIAWSAGAKIVLTVTAYVFQTVQKTSGFVQLDNYLNEAKAADIASAATTSIGPILGNFAHVTGTTTITSFGTAAQAGIRRVLKFDAVLTLTHNATSLILPNNGSDITTAAGDTLTVVSESTTAWRVVEYTRANGQALQPSSTGTIIGSTGGTDNRVLRADGTGGTTVQSSAVSIDDSGNVSGVGTLGCGAITSTGVLLTPKGSDIASASTVDLAAATGNFVVVTGTTTVNSLGTVSAGAEFTIYASAGFKIAHNASAINCPDNGDLRLSAGNSVIVRSGGASVWYVVSTTQEARPSTIAVCPTASAPTGWLLCYGQAVSRTTYNMLFDALGTTYGVGDGSTTFNLPDMRGRTVFGVDNMGGSAANRITNAVCGITGTTLGAVGGDQNMPTHTHGTTESPHSHSIPLAAQASGGGGDRQVYDGGTFVKNINSGTATTGLTINNAGTGTGANVPPAIVMNWMIKV